MGKTKKKNSGTADFGTDHAAYFSILCINAYCEAKRPDLRSKTVAFRF